MDMKSQSDVSNVESGIKNKFRLEWMQQRDIFGDFYSEYIRKIEKPGKVKKYLFIFLFAPLKSDKFILY